jgi:hypothetical protein
MYAAQAISINYQRSGPLVMARDTIPCPTTVVEEEAARNCDVKLKDATSTPIIAMGLLSIEIGWFGKFSDQGPSYNLAELRQKRLTVLV